MDKTPLVYNAKQLDEIEKFLENKFGTQYEYIIHEIDSEYVHTDTYIFKSASGEHQFITCGIGAREMDAPGDFKRCELVMMASDKIDTMGEGMIIANELTNKSKYPFRENTWFGAGHTIYASKEFRETFGYECFAFMKLPQTVKLTGIDENVNYLLAVPIYESEREWCVNNHTIALLEKLLEKHGKSAFCVDLKREAISPEPPDEDELFEYNLMTVLGIDRPTLERLAEYLKEQEQNGVEVSYDDIGKWVAENQ